MGLVGASKNPAFNPNKVCVCVWHNTNTARLELVSVNTSAAVSFPSHPLN